MNTEASTSPLAQELLLKLARSAIEYGLQHDKPLVVDPEGYPAELRVPKAVFITLTCADDLRGCIGTLEASLPLVVAVAKYAHAAAFSDPRFTAVDRVDLPRLAIHISILSQLEPVSFSSEQELIDQIRPGIDGLFLEDGYHRATLLPAVWDDIPEKREFLSRLKQKSGLAASYWSKTISVKRYTAFCFP
jgi:uncharacterized protein